MGTNIAEILRNGPSQGPVEAEGWLRTKRDSKTVSFLELGDGSTVRGLQVVVDRNTFADAAVLDGMATGCALVCRGPVVPSQGGSQAVEMACQSIKVVGECPAAGYPLQKKRHSLEFLREVAHLRPRTNTLAAVARVRSAMAFAVHRFFHDNGFFYVHTPLITGSDCEGAGAMFRVTTLDPKRPPLKDDGSVDWSKDFFGRKTSLTVSGQLEAEAYALALKKVYTFGPTFRAENSVTKRHLAEFWMVEPEMAFCDLDGNRAVAEKFLKAVFSEVLESCGDDLAFFEKFYEKDLRRKLESVVSAPFGHITYTEAIAELEKAKDQFAFEPRWGCDLQTEHERFLCEKVFDGPVAVTDYPKEIKSFYMKANDDGRTVAAMDVLFPRLGEIVGGSEREYRYDVLLGKMRDAGLDPEDYRWYLELRRFGSAPHAGFGLGFGRAVMYATGMQNIRDIIPFPRAVGSADF